MFARRSPRRTSAAADLPKVARDLQEPAANDMAPAPITFAEIDWPLEIETMAVCHTALMALDHNARQRALHWLNAACVAHHGNPSD